MQPQAAREAFDRKAQLQATNEAQLQAAQKAKKEVEDEGKATEAEQGDLENKQVEFAAKRAAGGKGHHCKGCGQSNRRKGVS